MKTIGLFYFSGTGNTLLVTEMIKDSFIRQGCSVDLIRMEDVTKNKTTLDLEKYELIGFGSQVIGYGVPNFVKDFINKLPKGRHQKTFIFRTAGGVAPINYNVSKSIIRALNRKGYNVFHERLFSLGSNWIKRFSDPVVHQLYESTKDKVNVMCQELLAGKERFYKTDPFLAARMGILSFISGRFFRVASLDYKVTSECGNCGLCIKNCPSGNIYSKNEKVQFGLNCSCCMRCVYNCPNQAIQFKTLKFFQVEGGYNIKKTLETPLSEADVIKEPPPFFTRYVSDVNF